MSISTEERNSIFENLKNALAACCPPMVVKPHDDEHTFEIMGNKAVPYGHKKEIVEGMYFASILHRKDSVAFYFFPLYYKDTLIETAPSLKSCLKGKTCFHFKKMAQLANNELENLLKEGVKYWKEQGYLE